jgi:hypothetical protein
MLCFNALRNVTFPFDPWASITWPPVTFVYVAFLKCVWMNWVFSPKLLAAYVPSRMWYDNNADRAPGSLRRAAALLEFVKAFNASLSGAKSVTFVRAANCVPSPVLFSRAGIRQHTGSSA